MYTVFSKRHLHQFGLRVICS